MIIKLGFSEHFNFIDVGLHSLHWDSIPDFGYDYGQLKFLICLIPIQYNKPRPLELRIK